MNRPEHVQYLIDEESRTMSLNRRFEVLGAIDSRGDSDVQFMLERISGAA